MSNTADRHTLTHPRFPGILLSCSGQLCAAIGFDVEPGRNLAITAPVFFRQAAPEELSEWVRRLLGELLPEVARRDCRAVRFVHPATNTDGADLLPPLLAEAGFSVRTRIVQWTRTSPRTVGAEWSLPTGDPSSQKIACDLVSWEELKSSNEQRSLVLGLLQDILAVTQDLVSLPSPDPEDLLQDWIRQEAMIVLGRRGHQNIALCVCPGETLLDDAQLAVLRIEYLGVVPEHRRSGAASSILRVLPQLVLAADEPNTPQRLQLTAFADGSNAAASQLYRSCGFRVDSEYDLWCREVS